LKILISDLDIAQKARFGWWAESATRDEQRKYPPLAGLRDDQIDELLADYEAEKNDAPSTPPTPSTVGDGGLPLHFAYAWYLKDHANDKFLSYSAIEINDHQGGGNHFNPIAQAVAQSVVAGERRDAAYLQAQVRQAAKDLDPGLKDIQEWAANYDGHVYDAKGKRELV
jgi:hypothetical protein